ncbi:2-dehydropantoate 2-reductase [Amphritea pacifica]|uniref:2-dehydropantoate 2-reductase n=1 Tax=Amphritea pacifica TaxID=2811233 RepID=A0ABS2WBT9_9GAMM|nr:2-dehydropantoate 2-reductase [Amphritea pacifica]MBN0988807.1 2-dehydropantoate 2-reductase [Amphritea pacifica]MBN1007738.1 2-dehydropantoate 2-reductase [Amphritea pacifica]
MNVCVFGAGAIGGLIAARLSATGIAVSVIARGDTLQSLQQHGIGLTEDDQARFYPVTAISAPDNLGVQDLIVIAVKQPSMNPVIKQLKPLIGEHTRVLLAMNGVPWWFFDGLPGAPADHLLNTIDPLGDLRKFIPSHQVIGCVVHLAATALSPGVIQLNMGNNLIIGEPYGAPSEPTLRLGKLLEKARFNVKISPRIQQDIWYKLLGNMTINPVSALTRATADRILDDPLVNQLCCKAMREALEIGKLIGCVVEQTPEERNVTTRKLGAFKTSMLQDIEAGRPLEYEALIGVVYEIAEKLGKEVPYIAALYGLIRQLDNSQRHTD